MARTVRNGKIDTRSARAKLAERREPYWTVVSRGCAIGYRKGKKGGTWIARHRAADGKHHYEALGTADDAREADGVTILSYAQAQVTARAWFEQRERPAREGGEQSAAPYTVGQALDDYMAWFRQHKKSARELEWTINAHIQPAFGKIEIASLTTAAIRDWHCRIAQAPARLRTGNGREQKHRAVAVDDDQRRARKATANRVLTVLKAALNHAYREGKAPSDDAWRRVSPFRGADAARLRYLSKEECRRLLNACSSDFRRLVHGALLSGCRYGELCRVTIADFSIDAAALHVRESKSGKARHVPLDAEARDFFIQVSAGRPLEEAIFLRSDGNRWGRSHQFRPLAEASKAARIEPAANFHSLRHTWASHRVMAGAPLMVIAQVLGHADTRMVEKHYGHLSPSYVRSVIESTSLGIGSLSEPVVVPLIEEQQR
jgi:integrase